MRQLQSDPCVQQHLGLKSTWDRARRTQHGLFTIFPVSTLISWGQKPASLMRSRERKCPTQGTPSQGALRLLSVEMVCQADLQGSFPDLCKHPQEYKGSDLSLSGGGFHPPSTSRIIPPPPSCFPKSRDNTWVF